MIRSTGILILALGAWAAAARAEVAVPTQGDVDLRTAAVAVSTEGVSIRGEVRNARSPRGAKTFTRKQGSLVGIDHIDWLTPNHFFPPFWNGRGLAAGDVNQDGFQDLLVATEFGVRLFVNQAGIVFTEQELPIPRNAQLGVHAVALVDVDDDGWLDLFFTTFGNGNFFVRSQKGAFSEDGLVEVPRSPRVLTMSLTFGDIDEDGDLDAALGNWYFGYAKQEPAEDAANSLLFYEDGRYAPRDLDEILGDTLSILLSDVDLDNHLDLIVGNDFQPPDIYYFGDGEGGFRKITRQDGVVPVTTDTTMSIDTGDFDNDLRPDIYVAQISSAGTGSAAHVRRRPFEHYCEDLVQKRDRRACGEMLGWGDQFTYGSMHQPAHIARCKTGTDRKAQARCASLMVLLTAIQNKDASLCKRMPKGSEETAFICENYFRPSKRGTTAEYAEAIKILMNENIMLTPTAPRAFTNVAKQLGVSISAWSWNSRFVDLDNDEWQDLYVVNGTWMTDRGTPEKFFFHNQQGKRFENATDEFGLQSYMLQSSYVALDVDNDGDLDIISNTIGGPIWFYRNNENENASILFQLRDHEANRYCIGCKVRIYYGRDGGKAQLRELKAGGGFLSFDPPVLHFGLGAEEEVRRVEVVWSTGETTTLEGALPGQTLYTIERR